MTARENILTASFDRSSFQEKAHFEIPSLIASFQNISKRYVLFNLAFSLFVGIYLIGFAFLFSFLADSFLLGVAIAFFFFVTLMYFVLKLYFQEQKPHEFIALREQYLASLKKELKLQEGIPELHFALANAAWKAATKLNDAEFSFYKAPERLSFLQPLITSFSAFCHRLDVHRLKELFLLSSIDEHIKLVKCDPTNLEVHAALANAYVMLSSHYAPPKPHFFHLGYKNFGVRWNPRRKTVQEFRYKFRLSAERAIEEFKILKDYAPNDPWVHAQLAFSYHDLGMAEFEIQEYETILKLTPQDEETLFKLGVLYFKQGHNAKGLRSYQALKEINPAKAEELLLFYGAYAPCDPYSTIIAD